MILTRNVLKFDGKKQLNQLDTRSSTNRTRFFELMFLKSKNALDREIEIAQRLTFAYLTVKAEFAKPASTLRRLYTIRL